MNWISVKDRLPDFDLGCVLISCEKEVGSYSGVFIAMWNGKKFEDWPPNCGCTGFGNPTHWMHLPEPPQE